MKQEPTAILSRGKSPFFRKARMSIAYCKNGMSGVLFVLMCKNRFGFYSMLGFCFYQMLGYCVIGIVLVY